MNVPIEPELARAFFDREAITEFVQRRDHKPQTRRAHTLRNGGSRSLGGADRGRVGNCERGEDRLLEGEGVTACTALSVSFNKHRWEHTSTTTSTSRNPFTPPAQ